MDVVTVDYGQPSERCCDEGNGGCVEKKKKVSHCQDPHMVF